MDLRIEVSDNLFVLHVKHRSRQCGIPVIHEFAVLKIELAQFEQVVGKGLPFGKVLLEAAKAAVHGVPASINDFGVRQNGLDEPYVGKVVRHLVGEKRR